MFGRKKIKALESLVEDLRWELKQERILSEAYSKDLTSERDALVEARRKLNEVVSSKEYQDSAFFKDRSEKLDEKIADRDELIDAQKKDLLAISTRCMFLEEVAKSVIEIGETTKKTLDGMSLQVTPKDSDKSLVSEILSELSVTDGKAQKILDDSKLGEFWSGAVYASGGEPVMTSDTVSHTN